MDIFISWSGERSKAVASALADLLPQAAQHIKPWMSAHDVAAGTRWADQLHTQLSNTSFGVICLTPENVNAPWLLFEAGMLAKGVSGASVVPYCVGFDAEEVPFPLQQFQGVNADEEGTRKLLRSLNLAGGGSLANSQLDRVFDRWWPDLKARIDSIVGVEIAAPNSVELEASRRIVRAFRSRVAGWWWEYVAGHGIGYFEIQSDEYHNSVHLEGRFYDPGGEANTRWNSAVARIDGDRKITYLRRCWRTTTPKEPWFHGYGDMDFEGSGQKFDLGYGSFYDVDRDKPENTVSHAVQLRRAAPADVTADGIRRQGRMPECRVERDPQHGRRRDGLTRNKPSGRGMRLRGVAPPQTFHRGFRGQYRDHSPIRTGFLFDVRFRHPEQKEVSPDQVSSAADRHEAPVGQLTQPRLMRHLPAPRVHAAAVQLRIDFRGPDGSRIRAAPTGPSGAKRFVPVPPAFRARPVPRGQGHRLVQKEKLRVKARRHHIPAASFELQQAGNPAPAPECPDNLPPFVMKRAAAVTHQGSPRRRPDQRSEWVHAVL